MILPQVLNLPLLINQLALPIFDFLLRYDPVIVDFLSFLLEESHELLLLFHAFFEFA